MKIAVMLLLFIAVILNRANCTNYYFSESLGNDAWSGTISLPNASRNDGPKRSLSALNTLLDNVSKAGDSIFLKRGDRWSGSNGIATGAAQGTITNYIFIGAYGTGAKPVIDKTGTGEVLLCRGSSNRASSFIKFQNLSLTTSSPIGNRPVGVYINESFYSFKPHHIILDSLQIGQCLSGMILYQNNILVENCIIQKNGNMATGHGIFSSANDVTFRNNVLDSNGIGSVFVHSVYISQCTNVIFEGNEIKNADDGLKLRASTNLLIKNNRIHDMYIHTIHVGGDNASGTSNVTIDGNIIFNAPQGLRISSESGTQTRLSENILIKNNIFPAQVFISDNGPVKDIYFYNNLIYSATNQSALFITNAINPVNLQIKNNIFYKTTSNSNHSLLAFVSISALNGITLDNNLYYFPVLSNNILTIGNNSFSTLSSFRIAFPIQEVHGQQGNPNFMNPVDFHLTSLSTLAIDKGADLAGIVGNDLNGNSRPIDGDGLNGASWDIGPYEYCCLVNNDNTPEEGDKITLVPNPTDGTFIINPKGQRIDKILIFDISGKPVYETSIVSESNTIQIENLNNGIYFIQLFTNGKVKNVKFIMQDQP